MLSRHQYTTVCDSLDTILQVVPNNPPIGITVRHLQILLTEQLLADVKKQSSDKNLSPEEITIGKEKGKIPSIKAYRERTGVSLKEAKDKVEAYFTNYSLEFGPAQW